ncbi:hypothetical protein BU17DRAFT_81004 [Hysterangium stoloniferum]|nr:hypothetical protein BU17DRAFT_81004 [Hysterangium stoloniferum]
MLSAIPTSSATLNSTSSPTQSSSLPRRTDSLSTSIEKPKPTNPLIQAREDAQYGRSLLSTPIMTLKQERELGAEERERWREEREGELIEMLARMTGWVEELAMLLQQAYKNQTDLETALTLTRSNLQLALANNEMLEDALKRAGRDAKDIGWRRWSDREGHRRRSNINPSINPDITTRPTATTAPPPPPPPQSRGFFNFSSLTRSSSTSATTSPTAAYVSPIDSSYAAGPSSLFSSTPSSLSTAPLRSASSSRSPSPGPGPGAGPSNSKSREKELATELEKERAALKRMAEAKAQLESELESLSQALFEEANKMVSEANRKLAETQEELRTTMEQREALKGALRIVEGENGALRSGSRQSQSQNNQNENRSRSRYRQNDNTTDDSSQIVEICNPGITVTQDTLTPKVGELPRSRSNSESRNMGSSESLSYSSSPQQQLRVLPSESQSSSETLVQLRPRSSSITQPLPQAHNDATRLNSRSPSSSVSQLPPSRPTSVSSTGSDTPTVTVLTSNLAPQPSGSFWSPVTPSSEENGSGGSSITPSDEGEGSADEHEGYGDGGGGASGVGIGGGSSGLGRVRRRSGHPHEQFAEVRYFPRMGVGLSELSPIAEAMSPPVSAGFGSMLSAGSQAQYVLAVPGSASGPESAPPNLSPISPQPESAASQYTFESGGETPQSAVFSPLTDADAHTHSHDPGFTPQSTVTPATPPLALPLSTTAPEAAEGEPSSSTLAPSPSQPTQTPATPQFLLYPPTTPSTRSALTFSESTSTPLTSALTASPGPQSALFPSSSTQRWSVIPKTPRSRVAIKSEFEKAMERMRGIVGDDDKVGDGEDTDGTAVRESLEGSVKAEVEGEVDREPVSEGAGRSAECP